MKPKIDNMVSYQPDNCLREGYVGLFRDIASEIYRNRWLTSQIMRRDISAMYKQSIFGLLWLVINPLFSVATFAVMDSSGVMDVGEISVPYAIFAVLGMSFWQLLQVGLIASTASLVNAGQMIAKINFSKKSLVLASVGNAVLSFVIQLVLVSILFVIYGVTPSPMIVLVPLLAIPMLALSLGLGFMASLLNAVLRDVGAAIPVLVHFVLFLTPVLYARPSGGLIGTLAHYNPVYYLVAAPRDLVLTGHSDRLVGYLVASALSFVVFGLCLTVFHLTESRVAERV